ncbi:MAG: hypothetical protein JJ966_04760 [Balneolaceae bacterium]|nr:hypothetical protein [Balneolaceae bacterium]
MKVFRELVINVFHKNRGNHCMYRLAFILALYFLNVVNCGIDKSQEIVQNTPPEYLTGTFEDDYEIQYLVNDSLFILLPADVYHIKKWNLKDQYIIAQNDSMNAYDPGAWTRIDWINLENMEPFEWAFCLGIYNAGSAQAAEAFTETNPQTPRTGCNGFPFSRMKKITEAQSDKNNYSN